MPTPHKSLVQRLMLAAARNRGLPLPHASLVAIVLPPGEGFGPARAGAVALVVRRLSRVLPALVIGGKQSGPVFEDATFLSADLPFWPPGTINSRYATGVAKVLRPIRPALIEVHNRTETALRLAHCFPQIPVSLFLHNDPQTMRRARSPVQRTALMRALARVVVVSEFLRGRLEEGVDAAVGPRPVVLPNPIDLAAVPAGGEREPVILFAGRIVAEKGADAFVAACAEALPHLPGWRAEMIGADRSRPDSPDTSYVRSVREAARHAGVRMRGYCDHPAVLAAMARASVVVVPSRWQEPFGLTALEAMACGAALIVARRGGLPEVVGEGAIYAEPDPPTRLADAILRVAGDAELRARLASAGRARARHFGLVSIAARLSALRRELIATEPSQAGAGG